MDNQAMILLDEQFKIISNSKWYITHILLVCFDVYKGFSFDELTKYIDNGNRKKLIGLNTEFIQVNSHILLDDLFNIYFPYDNQKAYVDLECENWRTSNPVLISRMQINLSHIVLAQSGIEYDHKHYQDLKDSYSIWVIPKGKKFSVQRINFNSLNDKLNSFGKMHGIILNVPMKYNPSLTSSHRILNLIHCTNMNINDRISILKKETDFPYEELGGPIINMCRYSEIVSSFYEEEGIKKGMQKGIKKGIKKGLKKGIKKGYNKGKKEGSETEKIKTAIKLNQLGWNHSDIAQFVDRPISTIHQWIV